VRNHARSAFSAEIAVGQEEAIDFLLAKVADDGVDMALFAHHAVRQNGVEIDEAHIPAAQGGLQFLFQADGVRVAENEFADRAKAQKGPVVVVLHRRALFGVNVERPSLKGVKGWRAGPVIPSIVRWWAA
jgi:hypothetical protein